MNNNPSKRHERLEELFHQQISKIVQNLKDPKLGFVTVTGLHLSPTFREAKVFYSVLGSDEDKEHARETLVSSIYHIRHELGKLRLRYIPTVEFVYDETPERADRVFQLLGKIEQERSPSPKSSKKTSSRKK